MMTETTILKFAGGIGLLILAGITAWVLRRMEKHERERIEAEALKRAASRYMKESH